MGVVDLASFVMPFFSFLFLFTYFPMLYNLVQGSSSFWEVLKEQETWRSFKASLLYVLIVVPGSVGLGLVAALLTQRPNRVSLLVRGILFHPVILPMVAFAAIWLYLLNPTSGPLVELLRSLGVISTSPLSDPRYTVFVLATVAILKDFGLYMVFFLAGLQNISRELLEAAQIDGANEWQAFAKIIWPLLGPTTFFVTVYAFISALRNVDHIWVLTPYGGVSGEAELLLYRIYLLGFLYSDFSRASALSIVLVGILTFLAVIAIPRIERGIHYEDR